MGQNDGHAGADIGLTDHGGVTDADVGDVGDGVERSARQGSGGDAKVGGAGAILRGSRKSGEYEQAATKRKKAGHGVRE